MGDQYIVRHPEIKKTCKPSQGQNIKGNMYGPDDSFTQRFTCAPSESFYSKNHIQTFKSGLGKKKVISPHVKIYPLTNLAPIEDRDYSDTGIDLKKLSNLQSHDIKIEN